MELQKKETGLILKGVLIGAFFPVLAITADLLYENSSFDWSHVSELYSRGPLHWIILTAPVVLGLFSAYFNKQMLRREAQLEDDKKKNSEQLDHLQSYMSDLEKGDFSAKEYTFDNEQLRGMLATLKGKLLSKKEEDDRTRWIAEGHARFGEILRLSSDLTKISDDVIKNLVRYVGLNQGSIFIHNIDAGAGEQLIQTACYAYERKKHISKSLAPGEGQVGQCYLEGETIELKKVPSDYIKITSGLGESVPSYVAIVPIKANNRIEGIMELAGFKALENYQVQFIEKVGEAFASVIRSVKVASETKTLLEETQHQTEQLRLQEEEIRQNMEEMHATQEQLTRQLEESRMLKERVERRERVMALTTILSETDLHGTINFVNDKFCEVAKYTREELIGKPQSIVRHPDMPKELFQLFWQTIKGGNVFKGIVKNRAKDGSHYWVEATIVPILNEKGEVTKYVGSRFHITDDALALALYNRQADQHQWPRLQSPITP
jgi:PAS domain S-box-containing protein